MFYYPFGVLCCTWGCSSRMWTEILDDVRNPLNDVIPDSVFASQKTLRELYLAKTEFDLRKTESGMTSFKRFLTSSQISVHILLLHPKCSTGHRKGNKYLIFLCSTEDDWLKILLYKYRDIIKANRVLYLNKK